MKKNPRQPDAPTPASVYPDPGSKLPRGDLSADIPVGNLAGMQPWMFGTVFPLGVYPVFDDDLPRDNMQNNITAANLEGVWPDPRLE